VGVRPGNNPDYGEFKVIAVEFDNDDLNTGKNREFAIDLTHPHELSQLTNGDDSYKPLGDVSTDEIMSLEHDSIITKVGDSLRASPDLIHMAQKWFPRDLLMDVNIGHLNLAEAVLDMAGGGPMKTEDILNEIGGLGKAPLELQIFSMNYALNKD